jgi:hypothetical protein
MGIRDALIFLLSVGVVALAGLALCLILLRLGGNRPVGCKTSDEASALRDVARWARDQVSRYDWRREGLALLSARIPTVAFPLFVRLSTDDLALLAPFIDQCIAGKELPAYLSGEYEDWRPAALAAFKARMQAEGLWPKDASVSGANVSDAVHDGPTAAS